MNIQWFAAQLDLSKSASISLSHLIHLRRSRRQQQGKGGSESGKRLGPLLLQNSGLREMSVQIRRKQGGQNIQPYCFEALLLDWGLVIVLQLSEYGSQMRCSCMACRLHADWPITIIGNKNQCMVADRKEQINSAAMCAPICLPYYAPN